MPDACKSNQACSYRTQVVFDNGVEIALPARPDAIDIGPIRHLDDELDISIVVVVGTAGNLHKLVSHANVLCINAHVLWCRHSHQSHCSFIPKCLVSPAADAADKLDCSNAIVRHQHTARQTHCQDHPLINPCTATALL